MPLRYLQSSEERALCRLSTGLPEFLAAASALWAAEQNAASTKLLCKQTDRIHELSSRNAALITGGDSFCYLALANLDAKSNNGILAVVYQGSYPLFDVSARIVDLQQFAQITDYTCNSVLDAGQVTQIGNLAVGSALMTLEKSFELGDSGVASLFLVFALIYRSGSHLVFQHSQNRLSDASMIAEALLHS